MMNMNNRGLMAAGLIAGTSVLAAGLGIGAAAISSSVDSPGAQTNSGITNFNECVAAGNPVQESFPRQCVNPETGESFIEVIDSSELPPQTDPGSNNDDLGAEDLEEGTDDNGDQDLLREGSTFETCTVQSDCRPNGCNNEICGQAGSPITSICVAPEDPSTLPIAQGYSCSCVSNRCQWAK